MSEKAQSQDYPGWHLVVGLAVFVCMTSVLALLAEDVVNGDPLTVVDARFSNWLHVNATPTLTRLFARITTLGSTFVASSIAVILSAFLLWRRQRYWFTAIFLSVFGGMLLNRLLKVAFQRARPTFDDPIFSFAGFSFPSGHTMTATVVYGALAAFLVAKTRSKLKKALVIAVAAVLIALVAFSRIYLGAHYLSDVLAAIAEGLAWLSLCFTGVYYFWRKKHRT